MRARPPIFINASTTIATTTGLNPLRTTTWTTFLPSFIFIFLGAPYIEYLRGNKDLAGALSGITAAVVGVILNLALVFGFSVILPTDGGVNWFALILSGVAFVALYRFKLDVLWVIHAGGALGLCKSIIAT